MLEKWTLQVKDLPRLHRDRHELLDMIESLFEEMNGEIENLKKIIVKYVDPYDIYPEDDKIVNEILQEHFTFEEILSNE
jgi:hypothetical protein